MILKVTVGTVDGVARGDSNKKAAQVALQNVFSNPEYERQKYFQRLIFFGGLDAIRTELQSFKESKK